MKVHRLKKTINKNKNKRWNQTKQLVDLHWETTRCPLACHRRVSQSWTWFIRPVRNWLPTAAARKVWETSTNIQIKSEISRRKDFKSVLFLSSSPNSSLYTNAKSLWRAQSAVRMDLVLVLHHPRRATVFTAKWRNRHMISVSIIRQFRAAVNTVSSWVHTDEAGGGWS